MERFTRQAGIEGVRRRRWATRRRLAGTTLEVIEAFYNSQRTHSSIHNLSPIEFEHRHTPTEAAAWSTNHNDPGNRGKIIRRELEDHVAECRGWSMNGACLSTAPPVARGATSLRRSGRLDRTRQGGALVTEPAVQRITTGADYVESLQGRRLPVYLFGALVDEPADHPIIRPSINAMAATYDLALEEPDLASVISPLTGERISRFLHVTESAADVVAQGLMQRRLGQLTGTCFQRCVGMDAINSVYSVTHGVDEKYGTDYHDRFVAWLTEMHRGNLVIGGAMTDVKGDRSKAPSDQADPDMYVHVVERRSDGIVIRGAKAHQTGAVNSHWLLVMPTMRLTDAEGDYAIVCAVPVDASGLTYVYGRQSCDTRSLDGAIDVGNAQFAGQEALVVIDDVFVPNEHVFLDGESEWAAELVERFTGYHRRSYVCKSGVGDVAIGAAALIADYNGVPRASHVRDKIAEMVHLNETIYATGIAASHESHQTPAGNWEPDILLANVCKQNVTRFPYEIGRLAQDLAGGAVVTLPSEQDLSHPQLGPLLQKYLRGKSDVPTEHRIRVLRLIENLTMGRNAVGYLTESLHGAGSPQAQRIVIQRSADLEAKKTLARRLAGIEEP